MVAKSLTTIDCPEVSSALLRTLIVQFTIMNARTQMTRPITAYKMVSLACLILPASPVDVIYLTPPMIIKITAIRPETRIMLLRIFVSISGTALVLEPSHPAAALTSAGTLLEQSSAKVGEAKTQLILAMLRRTNNAILDNFIFLDLL